MDSKQKAMEIFQYYYAVIPYTHTNKQRYEIAMKCSKRELGIIQHTIDEGMLYKESKRVYWSEVLNELNKIKSYA